MQLREKRKIQKLNAKMKDEKIEVTKLRKLKIAGIKYDSKIIREIKKNCEDTIN